MKKNQFLLIISILLSAFASNAQNFYTEGNGIKNTITATINGKPGLYISEIDGALSCYSISGEKLWRNESQNPAVMFEIIAADVDNDGNDDVLAASGDGHIYCWGSNGKLLWKFNPGHKMRFNEVAKMGSGEKLRIFAGGNDYHIYEISRTGKLVYARPIGGSIRKIEAGDFITDGDEILFVYTLKHDKYRSEFFGFIKPEHFNEVLNATTIENILPKGGDRWMMQDLSVSDLNKDGRDDIVMFGQGGGKASFYAFDGNFNKVAEFQGPSGDNQRYSHGIGTPLLPAKDEVVVQYGGVMYRVDLNGKLLQRTGKPHRGIIYNDLVCEPKTGALIAAGQVGGGNGLYFYPLTKENYLDKEQTFQGRIAEVEQNINELYAQTLTFKLPKYQTKSEKTFNMITGISQNKEVEKLKGGDIKIIKQFALSENTSREHMVKVFGDTALLRDRRKKYDKTREEVVDIARKCEADKQPFTIWAGHGTDPFYLQIETLEQILEVAPNTCYGYVYAEINNTKDPRVVYWANEYLPRLAAAIRKNGNKAKLLFRYKSMFWAATVHSELWKDVFFSGKYSDILVPSAEDTNNRLQDLNFSGRVGMFVGGYIDDYCIRLVDDNPTSWRPYSPGGQRSVSPYLRNGALLAAYGARYGLLFNIAYLEQPGMNTLYALMKSGVLPVVEKEDILSIGSWHLIDNISHEVVKKADDGHNLTNYDENDADAVVGVNSVTWCGTDIPEYDYSKLALGAEYRWLNFLPKMPYGMVPVTAVEFEKELKNRNAEYVISDFKHGKVDGKEISANEFGPIMQKTLEKGAKKMLMNVEGASWALIKIDAKHARLMLVDPGYIDPAEREVVVTLQGTIPVKASDILSGEKVSISKGKMNITVPAGSLRFIDLEYANVIK